MNINIKMETIQPQLINENAFRITDFNVYNETVLVGDEIDTDVHEDNSEFKIQIFGINEIGKTYSVLVEGYNPFFYVLVDNSWTELNKQRFLDYIKKRIGNYYKNSIVECVFVNRKKLYGFDGGKAHKFIKLIFKNTNVYNKTKNLWYEEFDKVKKERHLLKNGLVKSKRFSSII